MAEFHVVFSTPAQQMMLVRGTAGWRLPIFDSPSDWLAEAANEIRDRARVRFGVDAIALREIATESGRFGLMELVEHRDLSGGELVDRQDPRVADLDSQTRAAVRRLFDESRDIAPWCRFGWWAEVIAWIDECLNRAGTGRSGPCAQRKAAWAGSTVLEVPTPAGPVFFKATSGTPAEARVLQQLALRHGEHVPRLLAADAQRGWQLTLDFAAAGRPPVDSHESALRTIARIQRDEALRLDDWRRLGCANRTLTWLADRAPALLTAIPPLLTAIDVLSPAEAGALAEAAADARRCCLRAAAARVPDTIHHEDFRPGNVAWPDAEPLIFDWADTVIAHPFFSAHRYLDDIVGEGQAPWDWVFTAGDVRSRLRDAYLETWHGVAPERDLAEVFTITRALEPLYQLARYAEAVDVAAWTRSSPAPDERAIARMLCTALLATSRAWAPLGRSFHIV